MSYSFLDFEKPISLLEKKIEDLRSSQDQPDVIQSQVDSLNKEIIKITKELYSNLSIWQNFLGLHRQKVAIKQRRGLHKRLR